MKYIKHKRLKQNAQRYTSTRFQFGVQLPRAPVSVRVNVVQAKSFATEKSTREKHIRHTQKM